jgi:hypothetical protein
VPDRRIHLAADGVCARLICHYIRRAAVISCIRFIAARCDPASLRIVRLDGHRSIGERLAICWRGSRLSGSIFRIVARGLLGGFE